MTLNKHIHIFGGWDGTTTTPIVRDPDLYVSVIDGENTRGGIFIDDDKVVTIDGLSIINCQQDGNGAGLYVTNSKTLNLKDIIFSENYSALNYGGGAYIQGGIASIENCSFIKNTAHQDAGALMIYEANATIKETSFQENDANHFSALYFNGSGTRYSLTLRDSTFTDNSKLTSIGASGNQASTVSIRYSDANVTNNIFKNNGDINGPMLNFDRSRGYFVNNIVANNKNRLASLYIYDSPFIAIVNSIFNDNNTSGSSINSTIFIQDGVGVLAHNTISNNLVDEAIHIGSKGSTDDIDMFNNIITGHDIGILLESDSTLHINYTLWGEGASANGTNISSTGTLTQEDDIVGDPAFVDEANGDYHISTRSAARDTAVATEINFDIDNDERPQGNHPDIGADEVVGQFASPALIMYLLN
jgi:hypothetical protein